MRHHIFTLFLLLALPLLASCDKSENPLTDLDDVAKTGEATGITQNTVLINGKFDMEYIIDELIEDDDDEDILFFSKRGVLLSTSFTFPDDESTIEALTDVKDGGFFVEVNGLQPSTTYYYKTFLSVDFIIMDDDGNPIMLDDDTPITIHYVNLYGNTYSFKTK